nr:hypothetical protein [Gammaproteobacteria bacterium]
MFDHLSRCTELRGYDIHLMRSHTPAIAKRRFGKRAVEFCRQMPGKAQCEMRCRFTASEDATCALRRSSGSFPATQALSRL